MTIASYYGRRRQRLPRSCCFLRLPTGSRKKGTVRTAIGSAGWASLVRSIGNPPKYRRPQRAALLARPQLLDHHKLRTKRRAHLSSTWQAMEGKETTTKPNGGAADVRLSITINSAAFPLLLMDLPKSPKSSLSRNGSATGSCNDKRKEID